MILSNHKLTRKSYGAQDIRHFQDQTYSHLVTTYNLFEVYVLLEERISFYVAMAKFMYNGCRDAFKYIEVGFFVHIQS